jgi:hypothetical protein
MQKMRYAAKCGTKYCLSHCESITYSGPTPARNPIVHLITLASIGDTYSQVKLSGSLAESPKVSFRLKQVSNNDSLDGFSLWAA